MSSNQTNLLQGTLDLLILKSLMLHELHGLGVSRRIEQITRGTFQVKPGSLFPALHRLEEAGWLTSFWGECGEPSSRQVLPPHQGRGTSAGPGDGAVAEDRPGHGQCTEGNLGDRDGSVVQAKKRVAKSLFKVQSRTGS